MAELTRQIDEIPADSHVPVADAEQRQKAAKLDATNADAARDAAMKKADDLAAEADRFRKLVEGIAAAETKARLHRKLDELLGKTRLQRELVRNAEREIVRLANDTVQNLSDGELTIELENGADGDNEAFTLQVRRGDGPTPIGVHYLSGSQKFRVAIAVALAIGRFAAGQARRLESVIIDEGFGSLDRDGLRCAADELNRLRQHLRRIILVSHQEDFADRFPVVIRLTKGENGTSAIAERK
jgi:DNA repair exonuclease SbcCD ATPase subunit